MTDNLREEIAARLIELGLSANPSNVWRTVRILKPLVARARAAALEESVVARARAEALEEAAKVAETMYKYDPDDLNYEHYAGEEIAAAIRALARQAP
jgi:hypothetical protein